MNQFASDIKKIRERARQHREQGAVTEGYKADRNAENLVSMIKEDLYAERTAIESYASIVRSIGDSDPTTRKVIEDIFKVEEEHADDLKNMLPKNVLIEDAAQSRRGPP